MPPRRGSATARLATVGCTHGYTLSSLRDEDSGVPTSLRDDRPLALPPSRCPCRRTAHDDLDWNVVFDSVALRTSFGMSRKKLPLRLACLLQVLPDKLRPPLGVIMGGSRDVAEFVAARK